MGPLSAGRSARRSLLALGAFAAAIAVTACVRSFQRSTTTVVADDGPRIDHVAHLDKGLECADCHFVPETEDGPKPTEPKKPTYAQCADCHDDEDAEKPEEKKIKNLFFTPEGAPKWNAGVLPYDPEILFGHAVHGKVECATCPGELKGAERKHGLMFSMDTCVACHAEKGAPQECRTCHTRLRDDVPPDSHRHLWRERHGQAARSRLAWEEARCALCHKDRNWCERCHQLEAPRDHTNLFRTRTHGVVAAIDRRRCETCHDTDYCQRCHESTPPRSHRGQWARGTNTHCMTCHFPISSEHNCRVCHQDTPTHDTAPQQPPWHVPGMNCRLCHTPAGGGGAPPLRHVDSGMVCEFCHR